MDIKILGSSGIEPLQHSVFVCNKSTQWENLSLTAPEIEYTKKCVEKDETFIHINLLGRQLIIIIAESSNKPAKDMENLRKAGARIQQIINKIKGDAVQIIDNLNQESNLLCLCEGIVLSTYRFNKYFTKKEDKENSLKNIFIVNLNHLEAFTELMNISEAVFAARNLINEPANVLTSTKLSDEMTRLAKDAGIEAEVFNKSRIEALKMGGLLAVNKGSFEPPTFTILTYKPENAQNKEPFIIVGKGIVYDTGGLSLKPTSDSMDYMKCDMSGAAAVTGAMYAIAKNKLPVYIIALIPSTDNRISATAYAPGDIIEMYDGTTVENMNSDAEGRIILADALAFAKQYQPKLVIDLATLTGSAAAAIGPYAMVAMGNASKEIFDALKISGDQVHERIVEFPFWDDYNELIKSDVADIKNIGGKAGGAIVGGKFMEHFTNYPYVHLDIAGVAFNKKEEAYRPKGGVGIGVRLLHEFIKNSIK